MKHAKAA